MGTSQLGRFGNAAYYIYVANHWKFQSQLVLTIHNQGICNNDWASQLGYDEESV